MAEIKQRYLPLTVSFGKTTRPIEGEVDTGGNTLHTRPLIVGTLWYADGEVRARLTPKRVWRPGERFLGKTTVYTGPVIHTDVNDQRHTIADLKGATNPNSVISGALTRRGLMFDTPDDYNTDMATVVSGQAVPVRRQVSHELIEVPSPDRPDMSNSPAVAVYDTTSEHLYRFGDGGVRRDEEVKNKMREIAAGFVYDQDPQVRRVVSKPTQQ